MASGLSTKWDSNACQQIEHSLYGQCLTRCEAVQHISKIGLKRAGIFTLLRIISHVIHQTEELTLDNRSAICNCA